MNSGATGSRFIDVKDRGYLYVIPFLKRPAVVIRICALIFSIIVFGCVSSSGWFFMNTQQKEVCVMNMESSSVCHFPVFVGSIGFLAAIGFLIGEWSFGHMPSMKMRKRYLVVDMTFSGLWALFYAIAFIMMASSWKNADIMFTSAEPNLIGAIYFALLSSFIWLSSAILAYFCLKSGTATACYQTVHGEVMETDGNQYQQYEENKNDDHPPFHHPPKSEQHDWSDEENEIDNQQEPKSFGNYGDISRNIIKSSYGTIS